MSVGVDGFAHDWIRAATGGSWLRAPSNPRASVRAIGTDSRAPLHDAAFLALRGERHDGHDHLAAAVAAGARLLIVDRTFAEGRPEGLVETAGDGTADVAILRVDDTLTSLQALGAAHRRRLTQTTVIAVTGSAGKTTTRCLIHAALSSTLRGTQSPKSFNNAVGVPLTLLAASAEDRFVVVEVGMNAPGEIESLGRLIEPDIVVITSIGRAHLGGLGSVEAIAAEKASLIRCRRPGGVVIVPDGIALLEPWLVGVEPLIRFGTTGASALRLLDREPVGPGQRVVVDGPLEFVLPLAGKHNAVNALAAVAVARTLGVAERSIADGLERATGERMRMEATRVPIRNDVGRSGAILLVNDAYNANPESMIAGLRTFLELTSAGDLKRRIVVLGRMLELGAASPQLHAEVVEELLTIDAARPIDVAWLVGPEWALGAARLADIWGPDRVRHVDGADDRMCASIAGTFRDGDGVLLKGSRGVALERIATAMRARGADLGGCSTGSSTERAR